MPDAIRFPHFTRMIGPPSTFHHDNLSCFCDSYSQHYTHSRTIRCAGTYLFFLLWRWPARSLRKARTKSRTSPTPVYLAYWM